MQVLKNIQTYYSGVKPVMVDGMLYVLIALFGAMEAIFNADDAYKYFNPYVLYFSKCTVVCALSVVSALKMFRSTSYGDHLASKASSEALATGNTQTSTTQTETKTNEVKITPAQPVDLLLLLSGSGCAYVNSNTATYDPTSGKLIAKTHARATTFFDANAQLSKFRNSTGGATNTFTQGTAVTGLNESSSASNVVAIINAAAAVANKIP